ncbi:uncharacterized protein MELLADRAFT_103226 [Melampsora larici-populina 98AG31]|uniref:Uncharacterized protein n=1 Tax=Melampsora larici-populina (strain 98AG31 / pathotype 3-4-7) TaxID=747676 RepID=F4RAZ0_MELLP|nr:uncharacterized protein MELLADRAFT_103226 [Melampsora larici-populina 98AG31]EGG10694.1 hypothetical protein MELLADRAFT_103226 [Melampsora larici-populina 98AG31]
MWVMKCCYETKNEVGYDLDGSATCIWRLDAGLRRAKNNHTTFILVCPLREEIEVQQHGDYVFHYMNEEYEDCQIHVIRLRYSNNVKDNESCTLKILEIQKRGLPHSHDMTCRIEWEGTFSKAMLDTKV